MTNEVYHSMTHGETEDLLETHLENGLSAEEAGKRITENGYHELSERPGFLNLLLGEFTISGFTSGYILVCISKGGGQWKWNQA